MIEVTYVGPTGQDCTAPYSVVLDKEYTLGDFIEEVVTSRSNEWGYISLYKHDYIGKRVEYKWGEIKENPFTHENLSTVIDSVTAHGGYGSMAYTIKLKADVSCEDVTEAKRNIKDAYEEILYVEKSK